MENGTATNLTEEELKRYGRQIMLRDIGAVGQEKLKAARALVVGAGGLGSPAALYLAAAGVGTLTIMDADTVDTSNLQRQVIHLTADTGRPKAESAAETLRALNPGIKVIPMEERLSRENALELVGGHDVVVDCCDNFSTRYLACDACVLEKKPYVYGSVFHFEGQASVFGQAGGPCYRCIFREPPAAETVVESRGAGIIGPVPGVIGTVQAMEAIKIITGAGETLSGRLLLFDALGSVFRTMNVQRDPECPLCGNSPEITSLMDDYEKFCHEK